MRKKPYVFILAGLVLLLALGFLVYINRPMVKAEGFEMGNVLVMDNKTWNLQFSSMLQEHTVTSDNIFVTDSNGKRVNVSLRLNDNHQGVQILPPVNGYSPDAQYYTLHVTPDVKTDWGFPYNGDTKIMFSVTSQLPSIHSKEELTQYFKKIIKKQKEQSAKFSLGFSQGDMESKAAEDRAGTNASSHSETNNQVQGVDEGDMVKTDGTYIYQLINQKLVITKANPVKDMKVISTLSYKENIQPQHLFLQKDKLLVIGNSWSPFPLEGNMETVSVNGMTVAWLYDISNKAEPTLVKKAEVEGNYVTSRKIGSTVYFISTIYPNFWVAENNEDVDLRPRYSDSFQGSQTKPIPVENIKYFPQSSQPNYTLIASINIEDPKKTLDVQTYLGSGNQIFMSENNLFIAVEKYEIGDNEGWAQANTDIYKFAVDRSSITFHSSGNVPGRALNQFSMDEYKGTFRIATTAGEEWNDKSPSTNGLYILNENMNTIGEVTNLAKGERIYSVRFIGDKAYIVTFKQVDPLFVIDTSNPSKPQVLGQLKIPGFSTYLHPLDENHLIGFGFETKIMDDPKNFNEEPRIIRSGMKISLFDITDFNNPKESDTEIIGGTGTHSYLLEDHKALFQEPSRNLYGFPISVYHDKEGSQYEQEFDYQGALIYQITPENGIRLEAKLAEQENESNELYEQWENQVQRVIYIENHLYTLSNNSIDAYSLEDFTQEKAISIQ